MRFLNLILILLMWTEAVFAVSTTDNNKVVGKTLKVASEYVTSMSKIDGSFESGNTGWVASVGTITPTASTEFQGNYKGLWSATGTGTLDLQWTATASNTYEASAIVSVDAADSDHYVCAVVNGVETGCTLFDGPDYTPNKQIKVSVVADSIKGSSFYLRIKHTGTDAFNLSIDDGKIQPWTAQTVQTMEQDAASFSSGSTAVGNITFSSYGVKTGNLFTASGTRLTLNKDCYFVGQATGSGAAGTVYIRRYNQAGTLLEAASSSYSTSGDRSAPFTKFVNAGDYFLIYTDFINTAIAFNATCSVNRNNVVQAWQAPDTIGEIKYLPQNVAPNGFIPANGVTLGYTSGTYQGAAYFDLYKVLWSIATTTSTDPYYISSAKGASAEVDWTANKTIKIDESGLFTRAYLAGTTGAVGTKQLDAFQDHTHATSNNNPTPASSSAAWSPQVVNTSANPTLLTGNASTGRASTETRPMNVAKYAFIRYAASAPTLLALPTSKDNNKTYDQSLVSVTGTNWTTTAARFYPYRTISKVTGSPVWRMQFNITGTMTAADVQNLSVSGVTSANYVQSYSAYTYDATKDEPVAINRWNANTNTLTIRAINYTTANTLASITAVHLSGDIELASKPTWADEWIEPGVFVGNVAKNQIAIIQYRGNGTRTSITSTPTTMPLTTVKGDSSIVSIASNQFTLQAGEYEIDCRPLVYSAAIASGGSIFSYLYNITTASEVDRLNPAYLLNTVAGYLYPSGTFRVSLTSANAFELRGVMNASGTAYFGDNQSAPNDLNGFIKITKLNGN